MSIIVGYTTREHLLLDLDDTTQYKAVYLICQIMEAWPEVGDALLLYSSTCTCKRWMYNPFYRHLKLTRRRENYHVVFDNNIGYEKCCQIISTLAELDALDRQFLEIRSFRGDMTLRVNEKPLSTGIIPPPQPVMFIKYDKCDVHCGMIQQYLRFRQLALSADHSARQRRNRPSYLVLWRLLKYALSKLAAKLQRPRTRPLANARNSLNHLPRPCSTAASLSPTAC